MRGQEAVVKYEADRRESIDGENLYEDDTFRHTQRDRRSVRDHYRIHYDHIRGNVTEKQKRHFVLNASIRLQRLLRCMYLKRTADFGYIHFLYLSIFLGKIHEYFIHLFLIIFLTYGGKKIKIVGNRTV